MNSNMNPMQLIGMARKSGNPQQFVLNLMSEQSGNPFFANLITLAQSGNAQGIEQVARNILKEQGVDFDKEFESFKQMFGF